MHAVIANAMMTTNMEAMATRRVRADRKAYADRARFLIRRLNTAFSSAYPALGHSRPLTRGGSASAGAIPTMYRAPHHGF